MPLRIEYNDAWEPIPLESVDDILAFLDAELQPSHPLRAFQLCPVGKRWRKYKYLIEEEGPSELLWVLDLHRKQRIHGKTCYSFKRIESQKELNALLQSDLAAWVKAMKAAGAWEAE